jgi:hypothetical protein
MKGSGLEVIRPEVIEGKTEKIKEAVIGVEGLLVRSIDAQILGKDVEELAKFLLRLLAIFDVYHGFVSAGGRPEACGSCSGRAGDPPLGTS